MKSPTRSVTVDDLQRAAAAAGDLDDPDAQSWVERIERGLVRISTVTRLEIGYSFRTGVQVHGRTSRVAGRPIRGRA